MGNMVVVGRVAKGLELTAVGEKGEKSVGKFSLAVDSQKKDAEGKPVSTTFYNVETWDQKQQDALKDKLKPGESVMVNGQLEIDSFDRDGHKDKAVKLTNPSSIEVLGKAGVSIQRAIIAGRLTKDVEIRTTASGDHVTTLSVAENYGKEKVNFYDVDLWNTDADNAGKYLGKGSMVKVDGNLSVDQYDRADGSKGTNG